MIHSDQGEEDKKANLSERRKKSHFKTASRRRVSARTLGGPMMYRILVVDDDVTTTASIQGVLKTRGMTATVCGSAKAALEAFQAQPHDLILTDLVMTPMDGLALVREVRAMGADVPVVVMTGHETLSSASESLKLDVFDYLTKPFNLDDLIKTVTHALAWSQTMRGNVDLELVAPAHQVCDGMVAMCDSMRLVIETVTQVAEYDDCVFILGEEGAGRHLAAQAIHQCGWRSGMPFVRVTETTPAADPSGKALAAAFGNAGTIFLDEITLIPMPLQQAVGVAIADKESKLAEGHRASVPPRLIASSTSDVSEARKAKLIHPDLAARLARGSAVAIPPLRERGDDWLPIFLRLLQRQCAPSATLPLVEMRVLDLFSLYRWPGNVSELDDAIRLMLRAAKDGRLCAKSLPKSITEGVDVSLLETSRRLRPDFRKGAALARFLHEKGRMELMSRLKRTGGRRSKAK